MLNKIVAVSRRMENSHRLIWTMNVNRKEKRLERPMDAMERQVMNIFVAERWGCPRAYGMWGSGQLHATAALPKGERGPGTHWTGGWPGRWLGQSAMGYTNIRAGNIPPAVHPPANHFTDWAVPLCFPHGVSLWPLFCVVCFPLIEITRWLEKFPEKMWSINEILGSHSGEYEDDCLLGCCAV
jgi:hypothetical protein